MIEVTGHEQLAAWRENRMPPVERVRPGLWSIPVPIPINPLRYVLVYAFELPTGVAIVDAGWDTEEAWQALQAGLSTAGYEIADVRAILVTHIHPDHYGLAGRVREVSGAWLAMHEADAATLPERYDDPTIERLFAGMHALFASCGVPEESIHDLTAASMGIRPMVRLASPDILLDDKQRVDLPGWDLRALWTPGHSPGHLCFVEPDRRLLLSGDHVLPRISPNISYHPQQRPNPLADFLDGLARLETLAVDEVLPAHEYRFGRLADRVGALVDHHRDRLAEIEHIVAQESPATCWDVTRKLTWSHPWSETPDHMKRAANGETLAHLLYLKQHGRVSARTGVPQRWARA